MEWDELQRAMVVFAHPDDAEFGSAGTIAKLARDGKEVVYVVVTDGSKGSSDVNIISEQLILTRQQEQREAGRVLGVNQVEFLGFPDGMLEPSMEVRKAITASIRKHKPDLVISQSPLRDLSLGVFVQHPDHLAAAEATFAAVYPCARDRMTFPELLAQGLEPHAVHELWVVGTAQPDHFIDITDTLETKVEALLAHESQVGERVKEMIPQRAKSLGEPHAMEYAEGFRRIQIP
ncbi:MAG TPA: PIG-L family deacetylase [Chloroflexi bacterium]|jgi:LmbE family N-acetylglucosaminyl deacetylase|nr:PIG-L family deacetylase [Chloroflexota bacterium]